jgi:CheY-like chemotaxis protein
MARVQLLTDDLLFGSRLEGDFVGAGHEVLVDMSPRGDVDAIVADLTHDAEARIATLESAGRPPVLAFYSHVEAPVRERALAAGIEQVVPRSRIAREGPALLEALLT